MVTAANIVGAGNGLEVGRRLELLSIRGAEAEAEQALRLSNAAAPRSEMVTMGQAASMQVPSLHFHAFGTSAFGDADLFTGKHIVDMLRVRRPISAGLHKGCRFWSRKAILAELHGL